MWKKGIKKPGRNISDFVSFIDFAPTFLEVAGLPFQKTAMQPVQGQSLVPIFTSDEEGQLTKNRDHVLLGKERNDVGRPNDEGYPVRAIVKNYFLYIRNYEPGRWPTGNPETGYLDTDGSPTKTIILEQKRSGKEKRHWNLAFGKRPAEELYDLTKEPFAVRNVAKDIAFARIKKSLATQMERELKAQGDPRMFGKGVVFDGYQYAEPRFQNFYNRFMKGEKLDANWVNETDFEPLDKKKE